MSSKTFVDFGLPVIDAAWLNDVNQVVYGPTSPSGTLRNALAATGGSNLLGYDGGTVQTVLDDAKPLLDYTALRAYTGRATSVRLTAVNIEGFFARSLTDVTSVDNSGTIIVDASGRRWLRAYVGPAKLDWFTTVQGALTWRRANSGKMLASSATYTFATSLTIENQTHVDKSFILEGEGYHSSPLQGGTCFNYTGTTGAAINILGTTADNQDGTFRISDLAFQGAALGNVAGAKGMNVKILNNALLENVYVGYNGSDGFYGELCYTLVIRRGLYFQNFGTGIRLVDAANRTMLDNVIAFQNGRNPATINQANIWIYGSGNAAYGPVINNCDVSYAGRIMFTWAASDVANITNIVVAAGVATVTTAVAHGLATGNSIAVKLCSTAGLRTNIYGATVTVTGATTFTYPTPGAANGTYTSATDPTLVIGTQSNGLMLFGTYGTKVNSLYCENALGAGIYLFSDTRATTISGGFMLNSLIVCDQAQEVVIEGVRFQGGDAGVYIAEANQRATIDLRRASCDFNSGATITRGTYYMEDGVRYGPAIPTTGTWAVGETLYNTAPGLGTVTGWVCLVGGTPGTWAVMAQSPATSGNWGDSGVTLAVNASYTTNVWQSPLTANRAVGLSLTGVFAGARFRVVRTAGATGAFNLDVGTGPLKSLTAAGQWCDVEYNGTTWILTAYGTL